MSLAAASRARILSSRGGMELSVDMLRLSLSLGRLDGRSDASLRTGSEPRFVSGQLTDRCGCILSTVSAILLAATIFEPCR
jgi:hypothetical protein